MDSKKRYSSFAEEPTAPFPVSPSSTIFGPRSPLRPGHSGPSPSSETSPRRYINGSSEPISCVTRETFLEDCARHRFIVWAAVKRNSCSRMRPEEKLRCPLLRCQQPFPSHELMLRHLTGCEHLASGEYLCPEHMRVERFDDVKCKHCLGHPSKRRRMLSFAKNFFHTIGHRSRKGQGAEQCSEDGPPPPYPSGYPPSHLNNATELFATEIFEAPAEPTRRQTVIRHDTVIAPQTLHAPSPGLDSASQFLSSTTSIWRPELEGATYDQLQAPISPLDAADITPTNRPALQLTTLGLQGGSKAVPPRTALKPPAQSTSRTIFLSPSNSVRSNASAETNTTTASYDSSLISPMSNWSGAWSGFHTSSGFNTNLTSPIEGCAEDKNPFSMSSIVALPSVHDFCHELPADVPDISGLNDMSSDSLLFPFGPAFSNQSSYASHLALPEDAAEAQVAQDMVFEQNNICCSETKTIVSSVRDALETHILESTLKTQHLFGNALSDQLRAMCPRSVSEAGIRTLRAILDGHGPTSALEMLCFVHLVYSFSVVVYEQAVTDVSEDLFLQSLTYALDLSADDRAGFLEVASRIWQPHNVGRDIVAKVQRSSVARGKQVDRGASQPSANSQDAMMKVAFDFFDQLEISVLPSPNMPAPEVQMSDLYIKHLLEFSLNAVVDTPFPVAVNVGMQGLLQDYPETTGLGERLFLIQQRVGTGEVASVRRLELELIRAGKECMDPAKLYSMYVPGVRSMCDAMYEHQAPGLSRRYSYHELGVTLLETILYDLDLASGQLPDPEPDDLLNLDDFMEGLTPDTGGLPISPFMDTDSMDQLFDMDMAMDIDGFDDGTETQPLLEQPVTAPSSNEPSTSFSTPDNAPKAEDDQTPHPPDSSAPAQADFCCVLCGYRPTGHPMWFKGSMAKHMKNKHTSTKERFSCPYPGCTSEYNRKDNLRGHQLDKGHFLAGQEMPTKRPSKRKKTSHDDEGK